MSQDLEAKLRDLERQIASLTRRVYQLEQEQSVPPLEEAPAPEPEVIAAPVSNPPPPESRDWERSVGTNWLNRAGVLLILIGIVLFLGYAMTDMGPGGRVTLAALAGLAMLAGGYYGESKGGWRPWSLVMIAGGFAVLYATAYAAHAVEAARVLPNTTAGVAIQTLVALAAVWQAVRLSSERAATVAFLGAFLGVFSSEGEGLRFAGSVPLTLGGLWLAARMSWEQLPWGLLAYSWIIGIATAMKLGESETWGQPVAWFYLAVFAAYEIWKRTQEERGWHALWLSANVGAFLFSSLEVTRLHSDEHKVQIIGLLVLAGASTSLLRFSLGVRREALSEALVVAGGGLWLAERIGDHDPLLAAMLAMALALGALAWNARERTLALSAAGEVLLALVAFTLMILFPDSRKLAESPLVIRQALPQMLCLMAGLFAAGRWFTYVSWPSWIALAVLAEVTLWTAPEKVGTILLAVEAIVAVAAGLYLNRRPIRLGGLALFVFSVAKVFVYDLSELDTLPRIFSFIVLGALLLGASWGYTRYRQELQKYL